jgi:starvation-inducible outer membrane lipoprotein
MNKVFKSLIILSIFILAAGCTHPQKIERSSQHDELPKGSIQVSDDLYYVPFKTDKDGCMMFRAYSETNKTAQAILYQNSNGKFSMNKDKENCKK